tara:strand:+ start:108 stop:287 length:180 start_codon:yes stop_codon:yes gene_type:complete
MFTLTKWRIKLSEYTEAVKIYGEPICQKCNKPCWDMWGTKVCLQCNKNARLDKNGDVIL